MNKNLHTSIYTVASMTVISRVFGFIRDVVMAGLFGASASWDSFAIAFEIPNVIRQLFAEGSLSQAFIPVLVQYQSQCAKETKLFVNSMIGTLGFVLSIITITGMIFSPSIVRIIAPGFVEGSVHFSCTVTVLRITFPFLLFSSLSAFAGAILNTYNCFWVPAISPAFLSLGMIIAAIFFCPYLHISIFALAWAVVIAAIFQLIFQVYFLRTFKLIARPRINFFNSGVWQVLKLMVPVLLAVSVWQINILLDTYFASYLSEGSISWLYFSDRLIDVPIGIFGMAISTVILPHLSRCHAMKSDSNFSEILDWAFRCILTVGLPTAIFIGLLAGPLLSTLFQHGLLNGYAVGMACKSLTVFAFGLVPLILIKILVVGFYAKKDMRTPVKISLIAVGLNFIFNFIFILPFAHAGIALATSLSAIFNSFLLYYFLRQFNIYTPSTGWFPFIFRLLFSNAILTVWLYLVSNDIQMWIGHRWIWRTTHLTYLTLSSVFIYFFCLWLVGVKLRTLFLPQYDKLDKTINSFFEEKNLNGLESSG